MSHIESFPSLKCTLSSMSDAIVNTQSFKISKTMTQTFQLTVTATDSGPNLSGEKIPFYATS